MDLGDWLRSLGLERYEAAFRENEIDETVLPSLTHETLKELGVTAVGHRLKLLDAIATRRTAGGTKPPSVDEATTPAAPSITPEDRAERRQVTVMFSDLVGSTALSARMDPEGPPRGHFRLSEVRRRDCAALRRVRGEVHEIGRAHV
jgi:class 3 adenylate cyclase